MGYFFILCDTSRLFVFFRYFTVVFDFFFGFFQIAGNLDDTNVSGIFYNCFQWSGWSPGALAVTAYCHKEISKTTSVSFSLVERRDCVLKGISGEDFQEDSALFSIAFFRVVIFNNISFLGLMLHQS